VHHIKINIATIKEAELVADLSRQTFYETFAAQNTKEDMEKFMNEQFSKKKLVDEVKQPGSIFLLAEMEGNYVGYARLAISPAPAELANLSSIEIARIYSIQSSIGKGVGSALMKKCIEIANELNKEVIWLGVFQANHRAVAFYQRWGFEIFSEHDFILGDDVQKDWLMKKLL
jgi:ribosomal protein S18 acetylase RimI-like enzyme